jgi:hypothetical protein
MLLHLSLNSVFINGAIELFEKYYPEKNYFFIQISKFETKSEYSGNYQNHVFYRPFTKRNFQREILNFVREHKIQYLFLHALTPINAVLANSIKKNNPEVKVFWVFFGYDLYYLPLGGSNYGFLKKLKLKNIIQESYFYALFNTTTQSAILKCIENLDYFCFWNNYDYDYLVENFNTKATHKYFMYSNAIINLAGSSTLSVNKNRMLINHSASESGNHIELFEMIASQCRSTNLTYITPVSYGPTDNKNKIIEMGTEILGNGFSPITHFMKKEEYFNEIGNCAFAIFGHDRQEAAGNVFYLLSRGTKIFLKKGNTLYQWLLDNGFLVFCLEEHFYCDNMIPLTDKEAMHNRNLYEHIFSDKNEAEFMKKLLL